MRALICVGIAVILSITAFAPAKAFEELDVKVSLPPMAKPQILPVGYKWIALKNGDEDYVSTKIAESGGLEIFKDSVGCSWTRPVANSLATERRP